MACVSVIIPVYNTSIYLEKCLESLTNQTLKDIEIICIDDGSQDNSLDILKNYEKKDKRIKILTQKNQGQSVARNVGIRAASAEYIGFIDSDDWADLNMFEKLYANAKKYDSDISMCSITVYDDKTGASYTDDPYMTLELFDKNFENRAFSYIETLDFIFRICVVPWNKLFKKKFLQENSIIFPEGIFFEDNVFNLESLIKAEKISLVKEPLVFFRRFSKTSTTTGDDFKKLDFFKVFELEENLLKECGIYEKVQDYFLQSKKNTLIYWYKKLVDDNVKGLFYDKLKSLYPDIKI